MPTSTLPPRPVRGHAPARTGAALVAAGALLWGTGGVAAATIGAHSAMP
ncbi:hypothetical protein IRJ14_02810, partial [Isoptericola sp. QY 916]|nr:hypothetical protein [Isoptericola sp. QY 916]